MRGVNGSLGHPYPPPYASRLPLPLALRVRYTPIHEY